MNIDKLHCIWQSIINIGILLVIALDKVHILISKRVLTPFENIIKFMMKHKKNKNTKEYLDAMEMCKCILKQRTMYPMERIEYAIDYVKDKLIDQNGVIKIIDEESYEILLEEGATFLLGMTQKQLKEILIKNNLLKFKCKKI
ncbi:hypothetical protein RFI_37794 [Reticulomyxa filosa]|uniref:Uncharacterized protein n=1 Tax=Reticulomyxa filosa TaxID=46433 RepID=X6LEW3_RETFI|nr:hypothetical protein RFI_37794 [Reticulomyxa filosa]|eukprot:ETN99676.1 hypothetical protein RFI_37794 [Reticulomyxa filosa]